METKPPLPELFPDELGYCLLGAQTLTTRMQELTSQVEGAKKNEDIECVHKLRVASRRLRAALSIFEECFAKRDANTWRKQAKNITSSCGAARDTDVFISFLEKYLVHADPQAARGIEYVIATQKTRRAMLQTDVGKALASFQESGTIAEISDVCKDIRAKGTEQRATIKSPTTYEKAREHVVARLMEVLKLSPFVHDQTAVTKHHELRIAAKRLRYTMEIFAPLYENGLRIQIELMKQFQDVLGEMHDCYVWSEDLKVRKDEFPDYAKGGVDRLQDYLEMLRRSGYRTFVYLWDTKAYDLESNIGREIETGPNSNSTLQLLKNQTKVALVSDIHGNIDALNAVVKDARKLGLEMFLSAGDAVGFGIYPSQVVETLRSPRFLSVVGNVDLEVLDALHIRNPEGDDHFKEPATKELTPSELDYLRSLPKELRFAADGRSVLITHGSPFSIDEHIYPDSPEGRLKEIAAKAAADVIVTGHTHTPMNRSIDGVSFINPGSVGRPVNGDPKAEYAVLSLKPFAVEFRSVRYNVESLADAMRKKRVPEDYVQVMLRATPLPNVRKQERALAAQRLWTKRETIGKVRDSAKKFLQDETHAEQDRKLAVMIFNSTRRLHSLGHEERYWLECAAILHEIGLARRKKGYQKLSLKLILNDLDLPFTQRERYIIGSIARYHRRSLPDKKHLNMRRLNEADRRKVMVLSSILRLADALDASRQSVVTKVNLRSSQNRVVLRCLTSGGHDLEDQSIRKKKMLFERVFKRELEVIWKPIAPLSQLGKSDSNPSASSGSGL